MTRTLSYDFEIQRKNGHIVIEGMANAATVDRMKEVIDPKGWKLDNYRKNPTVLFDHGKDPAFGSMPIGKTLACEVTDGGLYTKIQLSNSKTEKLTAIRDLVEEGILKTFSVGFNPILSEKSASDPEVLVIKSAELIECSIVPIPMNQDSTFSVQGKSLKNICSYGREWLSNWLTKQELLTKGRYVAAAIHQRMDDLVAAKSFGSRREITSLVSESLNLPKAESLKAIHEVMDGNSTDSMVVAQFEKVLGLKTDFLKNLNSDAIDVVRCLGEKAMEPAKVVHEVVVSKEAAATVEAAKDLVEKAGFKSDKLTEDETSYKFEQNPAEGLDVAAGEVVDVQEGVKALVCPAKVSEAPTEEQEKSSDGDMAKQAYEQFQAERAATNEGKEGNPAAWVADEDKWNKAKEMAQAAGADDVFAFAVWAYLNVLGGAKKSTETETVKSANPADQKNIDGTDDNPYHAIAMQTNVLLGTLINEVQLMSSKLDGMVDLSTKLAALESNEVESENEVEAEGKPEAKHFDLLELFRKDQRELDTRLKRLNV